MRKKNVVWIDKSIKNKLIKTSPQTREKKEVDYIITLVSN